MFSWHAIPFVRILVPFIFGIFIALYCPVGYVLPFLIVSVLSAIFIFFHFNKRINFHYRSKTFLGVFIALVFIGLGYLRAYWFNEQRQPCYFADIPHVAYYKLTIDDAVVEKAKYYRCYAKVRSVLDSGGQKHQVNGTILFYLRKGNTTVKPIIGNQYLVKANGSPIQEPANPGEFNYRQYLSYHNIYYQLFTDSSKSIQLPESEHSIYRTASILRDHSLRVLKKYINSPQELGVAEALLMGYKDDLDPDITAAFMRTGTLHVLAVSGMHAGIIYLILAFITAPMAKRKYGKILQVLLLLLGIWLYAFMTGLSSSVLRASVMFSFISLGKLLKYNVNIYNNIYSSAFLLLLYNPFFIVDVGFQLSYLAVLGIVFIQPLINKWYTPRYWLDKYVWGLVSVSFAAQLLTFPIGVFYFHQFPNYFLLSNLLIIPVTSIVLIGLIALLALYPIPLVGLLLGKGLLYVIQFNNWLVQGIDHLPYSYINGLNFNRIQMFLMYAILLFFIAFCIHRKRQLIVAFLICIIGYSVYLTIVNYKNENQRVLVIHQIKGHDVFTCLDGTNAHIIADSSFLCNEQGIKFFLEPYFWEHGIDHILKHDLNKTFVATNIFCKKNVGFQFYDRFLTIDKPLKKSVQKNGILVVKNFKRNYFEYFKTAPEYVKISTSISSYKIEKIQKSYFEQFGNKLNKAKYFILISF